MKTIKLSKDVSLPLDIITQTIAILAKRRVGKSYSMRKLVEEIFKAQQQVVLVDPKGDQWGVRSTADGKRPGLPIVILGGEHGDIPLEATSGELVAKLVVEDRVSILLDLSGFRKHEIATFMGIFLENLYRLKAQEKYRTPVMLVIDEADAIAPQKPQKGEERMLGAAEDIVRRGGQRGIGCTLITQRSAVLNKNVLTQAQMLIVLRTIAPQDLAAMKAWIDVHGTVEQGKELMQSLPSLPIGDAWFWSPGWPTADGIFKRTHILPIETFDSAATPKIGDKPIVPKNLADVNLDSLKKQMAATIEKAAQENPKILAKRIKDLENQLARQKPPTVQTKITVSPEHLRLIAVLQKQNKGLKNFIQKILALRLPPELEVDHILPKPSTGEGFTVNASNAAEVFRKVKEKAEEAHMKIQAAVDSEQLEYFSENPKDEKIRLVACERAIYTFLFTNPEKSFSKIQVAAVTGYSIRSSSFLNAISKLNTLGLIKKQGSKIAVGRLEESFVEEGSQFSTEPSFWEDKLGRCEFEIYKLLYNSPDTFFSREYIAEKTDYSTKSSSFLNAISRLNSLGFIRKEGSSIQLNPEIVNI